MQIAIYTNTKLKLLKAKKEKTKKKKMPEVKDLGLRSPRMHLT